MNRSERVSSPFRCMTCICFNTVVYPVDFDLVMTPWTSRTVLAPRSQSTRRTSSSASVGGGGPGRFAMNRTILRQSSYVNDYSRIVEWLRCVTLPKSFLRASWAVCRAKLWRVVNPGRSCLRLNPGRVPRSSHVRLMNRSAARSNLSQGDTHLLKCSPLVGIFLTEEAQEQVLGADELVPEVVGFLN